MIIIKKKIKIPFLNLIKKILSKLIFFTGIITIISFLFITSYYFSSGMYQRFKPPLLFQKIDKIIFNKYLGFSIFKFDDYLQIKLSSLKYLFFKNKLENLNIKIDQENLYNLELQRQKKTEGASENFNLFSNAILNYNREDYNIKLRVKGDRVLHWYNKNETSYKIDLRGEKRIWGMEEFSVQKPITRNYTYEFIFHKLLEFNDLISLKYFLINLFFNDTEHGVYAVEEGFSKELIERNKKRNGPIFGVEEKLGVDYPNIQYDLYSSQYWISNHPELTSNAFAKLNQLKQNKIELNEIFDLEKWANFFAIVDLSNTLHGSISKSVKLYYNPVTAKFEPIGFDGHYGLGGINDFIILDFLDLDNKKCSYICIERPWYFKFLKKKDGSLNENFINLYIEALKKISNKKFLNDFNEKYSEKIQFFNSQLLSDESKSDIGYYKGIGAFIFDEGFLKDRSIYLNERLSQITEMRNLQTSMNNNKIIFDNINKFFFKELKISCENRIKKKVFIIKNKDLNYDNSCTYTLGDKVVTPSKNIFISIDIDNNLGKFFDLSKVDGVKYINDTYYLDQNLIVNKNYFLPKEKKLFIKEGVKINFEKDNLIYSEGSITFKGTKEKPIIIASKSGVGSLILSNSEYSFHNVMINNLSYPKDHSKTMYGGINIVNSIVNIINTKIENSNSEDAINIISSNSSIENLIVKNIFSDAIDIDFGKLKFVDISCEDISNDCLDVSGAQINGTFLSGDRINDKGLSFGENSNGEILNIDFQNTKLGIAVKDGSKLNLSKYRLKNNEYDLAVFNKKNEYNSSLLNIKEPLEKNDLKFVIGFNNFIVKDNIDIKDKIDNTKINELFY